MEDLSDSGAWRCKTRMVSVMEIVTVEARVRMVRYCLEMVRLVGIVDLRWLICDRVGSTGSDKQLVRVYTVRRMKRPCFTVL